MGRARPYHRSVHLQKLGVIERPVRKRQSPGLHPPTRLPRFSRSRREAGVCSMAVGETLMGWRGGCGACGLLIN